MNNWTNLLLFDLSQKYPTTEENIKNTKELILDYHIVKEVNEHINKYIEVFKNVEILSMSSCKLYSLENLPNFPNLTKIELNDNNLTEKEIIKLQKYPLLSEIYAANNKIKNFEDLKELSKMRELHLLDFTDNPICKSKDYRETIFKIFPRVIFLDGIGKNNEVYEDFEEENEEEEEEEDENEDDKKFIEDDMKNKSDEDSNDSEEEENEEEEKENNNEEDEGEGEEEEEDEIENPYPTKKKKIK